MWDADQLSAIFAVSMQNPAAGRKFEPTRVVRQRNCRRRERWPQTRSQEEASRIDAVPSSRHPPRNLPGHHSQMRVSQGPVVPIQKTMLITAMWKAREEKMR